MVLRLLWWPIPAIPTKRKPLEEFLFKEELQTIDEFDQYLREPLTIVAAGQQLNLIEWWHSRRSQFPTLFQMALDILSIPAMSTELERIFSSCEHLLSDRKSRTGDDLIEAIECLRSWWGQDLINFGSGDDN
jgi:hypothetical protein